MLFSNFTEKARIAISEAHDAAAEMGHNYIGSEHLLMGLIREGSGVAAKVLEKNGVTAEKVKDKINEYIGIGVSLPQQTELPLTPRSKRILEMSALEARRLNHSYIGTEHLLMAIIRDGDGVAAKILESLGVNLPNFYTDTVRSIEVTLKWSHSRAANITQIQIRQHRLLTSSDVTLQLLRKRVNLTRNRQK